MMSFGAALLLWAFLLCPSSSAAQDTCFTEEVASRMIVALEQAKILEQQMALSETGGAELQQQIDILKNTVKLLQDQIEIYRSMTEMQSKMAEAKDKLFEQQLKAAKPSFMQQVGTHSISFGMGALLAGLAILLL